LSEVSIDAWVRGVSKVRGLLRQYVLLTKAALPGEMRLEAATSCVIWQILCEISVAAIDFGTIVLYSNESLYNTFSNPLSL
jgi:hypothetical protein